MRTKLQIQFDGHLFNGWQAQKDLSSTVQESVNQALKILYKINVKTTGSGRTDSKVHALKFFVVFNAPFEIPCESLVSGLNTKLPDSIRVLKAEVVDDNFRPTNDATSREYRYLFSNLKIAGPFQKSYIVNTNYEFDFDEMRKAAKVFVGTHDFMDFHTKGSNPSSTIRTITSCELKFKEVDMHGIFPSHFYFEIKGSGFLKQMVRLIVGSIWSVGRGKITIAQIEESLRSPKGKHLAAVAPAVGLYKYNVEY